MNRDKKRAEFRLRSEVEKLTVEWGRENDLEWLAISEESLKIALNWIAAKYALIDLFLSTDRNKNLPPVLRELTLQIMDLKGSPNLISKQKLLLRVLGRDLSGDHKAANLLQDARKLASDWGREPEHGGPPIRKGIHRAMSLNSIWKELGSSPDIHRDEVWDAFCSKYPELLDDVQDERKAKSITFRDAKLSFLPKNPGGNSQR